MLHRVSLFFLLATVYFTICQASEYKGSERACLPFRFDGGSCRLPYFTKTFGSNPITNLHIEPSEDYPTIDNSCRNDNDCPGDKVCTLDQCTAKRPYRRRLINLYSSGRR